MGLGEAGRRGHDGGIRSQQEVRGRRRQSYCFISYYDIVSPFTSCHEHSAPDPNLHPHPRPPTLPTCWPISAPTAACCCSVALAVPIGAIGAVVAKALLWLIAVITNVAFFLRLSAAPVARGDQPSRLVGDRRAGGGRADHRPDGALRLGKNPRPRHSRRRWRRSCSAAA